MEETNEEVTKKKPEKKGVIYEVLDWIFCIVVTVTVVLLIKNFLFSTTIVRGISMQPTLDGSEPVGDVLIIDRLSQVRNIPLERGDIVVLEAPIAAGEDNKAYYEENEDFLTKTKKLFTKTMYVKRVIALPGEHVKIEKKAVYINGEKIDEPYVNPEASSNGKTMEFVVPEGYVWCMGDNRGHSSDSRYYGAFPIEKIEGRILIRIFPFNKIGKID